MNIVQYYPIDVINGPGTRCTLFVAGCGHHCKGCYNQTTWNPCSGRLFEQWMEDKIIEDLTNELVPRRGLSLSGGDPLYPANFEGVLHLVERVKKETKKDIWMWTGYKFEDLTEDQSRIVSKVDVVIDGRFCKELADPSLRWRGSSNQRVLMNTGELYEQDR